MQPQPIIVLDGSTVSRTVAHIVTHAFGLPMPQPYWLACTEWRRPGSVAGSIRTSTYIPDDCLLINVIDPT